MSKIMRPPRETNRRYGYGLHLDPTVDRRRTETSSPRSPAGGPAGLTDRRHVELALYH
jgi:hypothetical protein